MPSIPSSLSRFNRTEINQLFKKARRVLRVPAADFLLAPRQGEFARVLLVVSRKVGNSPERNKIKRRVRALFYQERLYEQQKDCVFIAKKGMVDLSFDELKALFFAAYKLNNSSA